MKRYVEEVKGFLKNKAFVLSFVMLAVVAFGFALTNNSISIDDLEHDRYVGSGQNMLISGRFGIWFWAFIQGRWENAYFTDIFALVLLLFAMINLCILFRKASGERIGADALTVFSCMVLTYPMIIDIWEYTGSNGHIYGSYILVSFALLLIWDQIHNRSWRKPWGLIPAALMMTLVCAGYESVVAVYIFLVCAVLALQVIYGSEKEKKFAEVVRQALIYAAILAIGVILRVIIHKLTLAVLGVPAGENGETQIMWKESSPKEIVIDLITGWGRYYIFSAVKYLPLLILVVCGLIFAVGGIVCCKKYGAVLLLPGAGMLLSLIILSLIQGKVSPYRTCQVFGFFCGFVAMMTVHVLPREQGKKKWIRTTAVVLLGCLLVHQASYINYFLELNHRRSEQEKLTIHQIGLDLERRDDLEKPVIFVGNHATDAAIGEAASLPEDSVQWKIYQWLNVKAYTMIGKDPENLFWDRKIPETILNSKIKWSMEAFGSQESMLKLFNYYGFDYVPADFDLYEVATDYAKETQMPAYPEAGYIEDVGDYVIVHLK